MLQDRSWNNFVLYYGYGLDAVIEQFDLIILDAGAHDLKVISRLVDRNKTVLAYLSGFEYPFYRPEAAKVWGCYGLGVSSQWSWTNNYLMDIRRDAWRDYLASEIEQILLKGYHGVFLDTMGVCQMPELNQLAPNILEELILAAAETIGYFRKCFPQAILVQNCGLNQVKELTAPFIDAICWEGFKLDLVEGPQPNDWALKQVGELKQLSKDMGIRVLLLAEDGNRHEKPRCELLHHGQNLQQCIPKVSCQEIDPIYTLKRLQERFTREHGFLIYQAPHGYVAGIYGLDGCWYPGEQP